MRNNPGVHYAWAVAGVTFLILLVGAGVRATPSVLIVPLGNEFAWSGLLCVLAAFLAVFIGSASKGKLLVRPVLESSRADRY